MSAQVRQWVDTILVVEECWSCGVHFGMTQAFSNRMRYEGATFFCTKGCRLSYGEGTIDKLRKEEMRLRCYLRC